MVSISGKQSIFVGDMDLRKHFTSGSDALVIPYALSMRRTDGGIGGALVIELDTRRVFRELEGNHSKPGHSTWVLNDQGVALVKPANTEGDFWLKQRPHDAQIILSNASGTLFDTQDRPQAIQVFTRIRPTGQSAIRWTVVDELPLNEALGEVRLAQGIVLALSLTCMILAIFGARWVTRSIVRPLESLALATQTIGEEGEEVALPTKISTEEISNLTLAFKSMRERISGLLKDIRLSEDRLKKSLWAMNEAQRIGRVGTYATNIKTGQWQGSEVLDDIFGIDATFEKTIPNWNNLIAPEYRQELLDYYHQVITGDGNFHKEYELIRPKDGQRLWVEALGQFSFDGTGSPAYLRGTISDIHKRKTAELALQQYKNQLEDLVQQKTAEVKQQKDQLAESEARLTLAVEGADVGIWDLNLITQDLYHSPRMAQMLGYTPEELPTVREIWDAQAHPDDVPVYVKKLQCHLHDANVPFETIIRLRHKDGSWRWILSRGRATRNASGRAVRVSGTHADITERKKIEEAAQAADRAKSEFLANMSHEIRTPMSGVIGMVDILLQTPLSARQQQMLSTVAHSSQTLLDILNDILDYSKIEAGKMAIERIPVTLSDVADSVVQLMQGKASEKGLTLSMSISPELPAAIYTDPTRLRQVLLNLLGNAIKFTPPDATGVGSVTLTLEPGALSDGQPAVLLRVRDHGIGMSAEVQSKLFTPFSQADASTSRHYGGTGLGLSISHRLVTLMGGLISVQSAPGAGSEFSVALPMQEASVEANSCTTDWQSHLRTRAPTPDQAAALGQLILLAEDNETNREVIEEQLRMMGYACEMAHDGITALQKWKNTPDRYALLLTDCHMPYMDGFELTQAIREAEAPGTHLSIIAITANAMQGEAQHCLQIGMDDYLSKPLRLQELASMLQKWLPIGDNQNTGAPVTESQPTQPVVAQLAVWSSSTLRELVGDNPAMNRRLLEKFLTNAEKQVTAITKAIAASSFREVATLAHTLKSGARSAGALALGELCQQMENTGNGDDALACIKLTQELPAAFAMVHEAIQAHLALLPSPKVSS